MNVRPASSGDIPAVLAIQRLRPVLPQWTEAHFNAEVRSPRSHFVVMEEDAELVAYASLILIPPEAQVSVIAVAPDHARRGLGKTLLDRLIEAARERECSRLTLEVSSLNAPALALYTRAGFAVVGRRPKFYNDGSDAVLMDLDL